MIHFINNIIIFDYVFSDNGIYMSKKIEEQDEFALFIASYLDNEEIDKKIFLNNIKKIAKKGNLDAKCYLALAYTNKDLCRVNKAKARALFEEAASKGHARSKAHLATILGEEAKSKEDYKVSIALLNEAVALGDLFAMYFLGNLYLIVNKDLPIKYNKKKALNLIKRSANEGFLMAKDCLANHYKEDGSYSSLKKAFELYEELTLSLYPQSFAHLGQCYCEGLGVKQDIDKGHELFLKGAQYNENLSFYFLSILYYSCDYLGIDKDKGLEYLEKAANLKCADAQLMLSIKYEEGEDVKKSKERALELLKAAIENGSNKAKLYLAGKLLVGDGVRANTKKALQYLQELIDEKYEPAYDILHEVMSDKVINVINYVE